MYLICFLQYSVKSIVQLGFNRYELRESIYLVYSVGVISSSVYDLSFIFWYALDVWRCINYFGGGFVEVLRVLVICGMGLLNENWY